MSRLLIVDDEDSDLLLERTILEHAGHQVYTARSGEEALRLYGRVGIQIVITDLQMPKGDGFELITALRDFSPRPAIIAVSGTGDDQLQMASALGATFTLPKPLDAEKLIEAVHQLATITPTSSLDPRSHTSLGSPTTDKAPGAA